MIRDSAGNLYGTAYYGGPANLGVLFRLNAAGHEKVLYGFPGASDGVGPWAGVTRDSTGNLYGTTLNGGPANAGVVYKLSASGQEAVLYSFTGGADGAFPYAGVVADSSGNLYGTTTYGGALNAGVVYKVDTGGHETVLYTFTGGADGANPYGGVILDPSGNLYGTTENGGLGYGVVYKLDTSGHETALYAFQGSFDGAYPLAGVIRDSAGNLYGTTPGGFSDGQVFRVDASGNYSVLYVFGENPNDGFLPFYGVIRDSKGNLYGTTIEGGTSGYGTVYMLDRNGNETILYNFTGGADGYYPTSGVIRDPAGNLYGTTQSDQSDTVFMVAPGGSETTLYTFTGVGGAAPSGGLTRDSKGNLYGTTTYGGKKDTGVVFKITPPPGCGVSDISSHATVVPGPFTYIAPSLYEYSQTPTVTYNGVGTVPTAYLVLHGEPTAKVFLDGKQLVTHCFSPAGDYLIPLGELQPAQPVGVPLVWVTNDVPSTGITYTTKVLNGLPNQ